MGHGWCQQFNKQAALLHSTSEPKIIGDSAWKLLKAFSFDPRELRGISIQIQKLQKVDDVPPAGGGQGRLPFHRINPLSVNRPKSPPKDPAPVVPTPSIAVESRSQDDDVVLIDMADTTVNQAQPAVPVAKSAPVDLPSFSQVDQSVLEALPDDVRKELEAEYRRRSASPFVAPVPPVSANLGLRSEPLKGPLFRLSVRGTSNVKRITQALAPKSRGVRSPTKTTIFAKSDNGKGKEKATNSMTSAIDISADELRSLDLDPDIFALLPKDIQREQLAGARHAKGHGGATLVFADGKRKALKPMTGFIRDPNAVRFIPPPPPHVNHPEPPFLKQISHGEKSFFTLAEDVQDLIEAWIDRFRERPPKDKDVEYFAKFLLQSVDGERSTYGGIEKAIGVLKWWLMLLRMHFGTWEHAQGDTPVDKEGRITSEMVGRAWWKAFRDVKGRMDVAARKSLGGGISVR
jgi:DNA repair protein REV1